MADLTGRTVVFAVPVYDHRIHIKTAGAIMETGQLLAAEGALWTLSYIGGCSLIHRARNSLITNFLDGIEGGTDFVFVDSDIVFRPKDMVRMLKFGDDFDIVVGPYRQKKDNVEYRVRVARTAEGDIATGADGLLAEIERAGTGLMVIRRHVVETLAKKFPDKYLANNGQMDYPIFSYIGTDKDIGEDYLFCDRARAEGFKIWADINAVVTHVGEKEYVGCYGKDVVAIEHHLTPA